MSRRSRKQSQPPKDRSRFREFLETTTIHGFPEIARTKEKKKRALFAFILSCCCLWATYEVAMICVQYKLRPISTSYTVEQRQKIPLPDPLVCPFSRFDQRKIREFGISSALARYLDWSFVPVFPTYPSVVSSSLAPVKRQQHNEWNDQLEEILQSRNITMERLLIDLGYKCRDFVKLCQNGSRYNPCCMLAKPVLTQVGLCVRFQGGQQETGGAGNGMLIHAELTEDRARPDQENAFLNEGLMIELEEPEQVHRHDLFFIPKNVHALVSIDATKMEFINDPPNFRCRSGRRGVLQDCLQRCQGGNIAQQCECRPAGIFDNDTLPVCTPSKMINCWTNKASSGDPKNECFAACVQLCDSWKYSVSITYANFNPTKENGTSHFLIDMFHARIEYTLIKHFPSMTFDQFISNIGGQLSLWLGGSVFSFIHLFIFLWSYSQFKSRERMRITRERSESFAAMSRMIAATAKLRVNNNARSHSMSEAENLTCGHDRLEKQGNKVESGKTSIDLV